MDLTPSKLLVHFDNPGKKLKFGVGSDLKIWHDAGSNSYIEEGGEGGLVFASNHYYFQNAGRTATTFQVVADTGITVTGTSTTSGNATFAGDIISTKANGVISGSLTSTGSFGSLVVSDKVQGDLTIRDSLTVNKGLTVNDNQEAAYDFIVKSQNKSHTLYVDSNKDKVGIGFDSPAGKHLSSSLHVVGDIFASGTGGHVTASGNISASGDISGSDIHAIGDIIGEDLYLGEYIYHKGGISGIDNDTYLRFRDNRVNLVAGGKSAIHYDSSAGKIVINNSNEDVDFHVMAEDNSELLATDAANNRVGINTTAPAEALTVSGNISANGTITAEDGEIKDYLQAGRLTVNSAGLGSNDFRVEGTSTQYLIFADANENKVGFNFFI